jgi:hypothetical protein
MAKGPQWFKFTAMEKQDENGDVVLAEHRGEPIFLRQRFYDADGEQLLAAAQIPSEGVPQEALNSLIETLTIVELSPTLLIGPNITLARLEPLSEVESRRKEQEYARERHDPSPELTAEAKMQILRGWLDKRRFLNKPLCEADVLRAIEQIEQTGAPE